MATAPALPPVSVDDYFIGGYEKEWEYVDGALVPRNSGSRDHARMVMRIGQLLVPYEEAVTAYAGFVLNISQSKYRVPDVVCYPAGMDPGDALAGQKAPLAVFEILSKNDPMAEMQQKCSEYRQLGIESIFIVDLLNKAVLVPSGPGFTPLEERLAFDINGQSVSIPFTNLFQGFPS